MAKNLYMQVLGSFPARQDANKGLLNIFFRTNQWSLAEQHASKWIELEPRSGPAWLGLALAKLSLGKDALAAAQGAVSTSPTVADSHDYLGIALRRAGRLAEAVECFKRSLKLRPGVAGTLINLANTLKDMGLVHDAIDSYNKALAIDPGQIQGMFNLGLAYSHVGDYAKGKDAFLRALSKAPNFAEAHNGLGLIYKQQNQLKEAEASFRLATEMSSNLGDAQYNLSIVLHDQSRHDEAQACLDKAIALMPTNGMFRVAKVTSSLPVVPATESECAEGLFRFDQAVQAYEAWRSACEEAKTPVVFDTISTLPFGLAYRLGNPLGRLSAFADGVNVTMPDIALEARPVGGKIKLGIVSHHVRRHSVWDIVVKGLVQNLDRSRFELTIYHLGLVEDADTEYAKQHCNAWRDAKAIQGSTAWATQIAQDQLDVIFYPELGMDPTSYLLAKQRLAALQIAGWGHPVSSGLSTVDWYCSGELLEPPDAQDHYREKLIRLPGTGCCTTPIADDHQPIDEVLASVSGHGPVLLFPHMPFKLDPSHDWVLVQTAKSVGDCTLVIPKDSKVGDATDKLISRLQAKLDAEGVTARIVAIPWLEQSQFRTLLQHTDVYLDCPSFSGYTTAWMAAREGTPIVCVKGEFMRQRLAAALLEHIGVTDTIAKNLNEYVSMATQLARAGVAGTQALRQKIQAAAPKADDNRNVIETFQQLVWGALKP